MSEKCRLITAVVIWRKNLGAKLKKLPRSLPRGGLRRCPSLLTHSPTTVTRGQALVVSLRSLPRAFPFTRHDVVSGRVIGIQIDNKHVSSIFNQFFTNLLPLRRVKKLIPEAVCFYESQGYVRPCTVHHATTGRHGMHFIGNHDNAAHVACYR